MSSTFSAGPLGPASSQNFSKSASNMASKSTPQTLGWDQTSGLQANNPHVKHPPPLPPRENGISPQLGLMMQMQPAQIRDTKYNTNDSYQAPQSYKAYDPRSAVPATTTSQRPDNRSPMSNLADQNAELMEQLRAMHIECDRKTTAVDGMVTEILEIESLLAEKEAEIARLSAELEQKTPQFSKMEGLFKKRQAEALEEKERKIMTLQEEVTRLSTSTSNTETTLAGKHNAELSDLQQKSARLQEKLAEKDDVLRQTTSALRAWESGWQSHMQKEKEKLEAAIESKYSGPHSELREQQTRREEAEARLRDLETKQCAMEDARSCAVDEKVAAALAQVELQKNQSETYLQQLRDLQNSNATLSQQIADSSKAQIDTATLDHLKAELNEARRLANFFKKNSEQTSKTSKEVASANRALEEAMAAKTREVDEQNSLIQAMKMQLGDMGGQYSEY